MGLLNVDDLRSGMVLSADLLTVDGRLLLPRKSILTDRTLSIIRMWGILNANIEGVSRDEIEMEEIVAFSPDIRRKIVAHVDNLFSTNSSRSPLADELHRIAVIKAAKLLDGDEKLSQRQSPLRSITVSRPPAKFSTAEALVASEPSLCSLSDVYVRISGVLRSPRSSASHIAEEVCRDTSLSTRLLRLVNSAFYGFPGRITSMSRAVAIIGANELLTIAMGILIISAFDHISSDCVDMKSFWKHSIYCGIVARMLASHLPVRSEERFFLAGVLHDVGRILLLKNLPEEMADAMSLSAAEGIPLSRAERRILGYDHSAVGGALLKGWRTPYSLEDVVRFHHDPSRAREHVAADVLHIADLMTVALERGSSGACFLPEIHQEAWDRLNLSLDVLEGIAGQADRQFRDIINIFIK